MGTQTAFGSGERFSQTEFGTWLQRERESDRDRYELIGGRIVVSAPAGAEHGNVASRLNYILQAHVTPRRLGCIYDSSTGYDLPSGDTLAPDVSFVARRRLESRQAQPDDLRAAPAGAWTCSDCRAACGSSAPWSPSPPRACPGGARSPPSGACSPSPTPRAWAPPWKRREVRWRGRPGRTARRRR